VTYFFVTDRVGRRASLAYLRRVEAVRAISASDRHPPGLWESFLHYRAFALSIFDRMCFWFGRGDEYAITFEGREHFRALAQSGTGAVVVGAHLGNFDAMRLLAARDGTVVNVLMFTKHAPLINSIFRELSPNAEMNVIHADPTSMKSVFEIRSCIERGELVAILGDRVEPGDRSNVRHVPFLGDTAPFPEGPFVLSALLGCPVMLMVALREGPRGYRVFAEPLAAGGNVERAGRDAYVESLLAAYVDRLEHYCTRAPYQWFNFYDFWEDDAA
jgi:predicted LPLAT superfamily acyltransferase